MKPNVGRGKWGLRLGVVCLGMLFSGCVDDRQEQDAKVDDKGQALTAELATKALLEMDWEQIPPGVIVPRPRAERIDFFDAGQFREGNWTCDLKKKTFAIHREYPNAERHKFNDVCGVFERTPGGKWVAKVTDTASGH
jgi:hypothetical protein